MREKNWVEKKVIFVAVKVRLLIDPYTISQGSHLSSSKNRGVAECKWHYKGRVTGTQQLVGFGRKKGELKITLSFLIGRFANNVEQLLHNGYYAKHLI